MKYNLTIRGQIGGWFGISAEYVTAYLSKHKDEPIDVAICSPGGYVDEGLEIYQAFRDHGNVHAHIIGMTASAATIVAMGAKTVDMAKNSLILIHNASTFIDDWGSVNKEKLDQLLAKYQKQRDDLSTIDDLIANIYADRCHKSLEDIHKKMTDGKWLSSQAALDFGLVDSVREDEQADKVLDEIRTQYSNSIIKDFGLPALPVAATAADVPAPQGADPVADAEGNPTESFLQKTLQALKDLLSKPGKKTTTAMNKIFTALGALLAIDAFQVSDGCVSLKEADVQKVEDHLQQLQKDIAAATQAKADVQAELDQTKATLSEKETEITALKGAAGAQADTTPDPEPQAVDHEANKKLFNLINPD